MKNCFTNLLAILMSVCLLTACSTPGSGSGFEVGEESSDNSSKSYMPQTVIQIGDTFEYYPGMVKGHFLCKVNNVRILAEESRTLPYDKFYCPYIQAYPDGSNPRTYYYEEWYTDDSPFDHGARIMLVDCEVTNVDAVANWDDGTNSTMGWFHDPYAFYMHDLVNCVDLTSANKLLTGHIYYGDVSPFYLSYQYDYSKEDDRETHGDETAAIQILPNETVHFTLGFGISGCPEGTKDLSMQWLLVSGAGDADTGLFIDTKLGGEHL